MKIMHRIMQMLMQIRPVSVKCVSAYREYGTAPRVCSMSISPDVLSCMCGVWHDCTSYHCRV